MSKPRPNSTPLHGLDAHEALGQPPVELAVPMDVASQARRNPGGHHFEDAAQGVPFLLARVDELNGLLLCLRIRHAHGGVLRQLEDLVVALPLHVRLDAAERAKVAPHLDRERLDELPAEGTHRHPGHGLAGAGALQDVTDVRVAVLQDAGEVRVARTGLLDWNGLAVVLRVRRHLLGPVLPVAVVDAEGHRRAQGPAPPEPGPYLHLILLDEHPAATAVTLLPPPEIVVDLFDVDIEPRGHALDDGREARAVGLSCGEIAQHVPHLSLNPRPRPAYRVRAGSDPCTCDMKRAGQDLTPHGREGGAPSFERPPD